MAQSKRTSPAARKRRSPAKKRKPAARFAPATLLAIACHLAVAVFLVVSLCTLFYVIFFQVVVAAEAGGAEHFRKEVLALYAERTEYEADR